MRVIIVGAGDVGKQMARILCEMKNDVVVIDLRTPILERLSDSLDIMTVSGNGAMAKTLAQAGADKASLFLAVTDCSEANILACGVARELGVPTKIARVRSGAYFDVGKGVSAEKFGVDEVIITEYECANDIMDALLRPAIKETVHCSHADAQLVNFQVKAGSPLIGVQLSQFPRPEFLDEMRFCAILRYGQMILPRGNTTFIAFDEVYVAGEQTAVDELIAWADPDSRVITKVVVAGATHLGRMLASMLTTLDMRVTVIEADQWQAEKAADLLGSDAIIIHGESTDTSVLQEAGVERCDAFIGAHVENERNILSCMLASRCGAGKVIAVTNDMEYLQIIAGMNSISCGFSPVVSAVNNLINHIGTDKRRTVAILKRLPAEVMEMTIAKKSPIAGVRIADAACPTGIIFALIVRDGDLVAAIGREQLLVGDRVTILVDPSAISAAEALFSGT